MLQANLKIDLFMLLVLALSSKFPSFPVNSIRAQLMLSICTLMSYGWDIFILVRRVNTESIYSYPSVIAIRFFGAVMMLSKAILFYEFLQNVQGAQRVRKYLHRRFRLFLFPLEQPKRIMRDVRGRYLALAWLHVVSFCMFLSLWFILVYVMDYNVYFLNGFSSQYLIWFLAGKAATTLACIFGLWYDIDVCLCLLHFGCCVFTMPAIRRYIRQRRAVLGGYPLAVSFFPFRFTLWQILKAVDLLVGGGLWVIVGMNAGSRKALEATMYAFLASLGFVLCVSDVWSLLIIIGIRWLLSRNKMLQKLPVTLRAAIPSAQASMYSDDSELDEFNLRCPIPIQPEKHQASKSNKKQPSGSKRNTVAHLKKDPISMASLMTTFLFPGRYLQEDGDVQSLSSDSDNGDNDDKDGEDSDVDHDWDEQSKLIAKKIEDKVQSTWSKFQQALTSYRNKVSNPGSKEASQIKRNKKRSGKGSKKTRIGVDPLSMTSFIEDMEEGKFQEADDEVETAPSYVDIGEIKVGTLRKKPVVEQSLLQSLRLQKEAEDSLLDDSKVGDDTMREGEMSFLTDDMSFLSANTNMSLATPFSSIKKAAGSTWFSSLQMKSSSKKARILPSLITDTRGDEENIPGWENDDRDDDVQDASELNASLQQEDETLQNTRRRMKVVNDIEDGTGAKDDSTMNHDFEEFDVLDQRIDQPYVRPKADGSSASKVEGANPIHRLRLASANKPTRVSVDVEDMEETGGFADSDNDNDRYANNKRYPIRKKLDFGEEENEVVAQEVTGKGQLTKKLMTKEIKVGADPLSQHFQQRMLCPNEELLQEKWKHWRYRWLASYLIPLRAQRVQFSWPLTTTGTTRGSGESSEATTLQTRPAYFDTQEEEFASRELLLQRLHALESSLRDLLERHPLHFQVFASSKHETTNEELSPSSLRPPSSPSSLDLLSPRKVFAQTLLRDDSGRLGVCIDDSSTIEEQATSRSKKEKTTWASKLFSGKSSSSANNTATSVSSASYLLVLWEFSIVPTGIKVAKQQQHANQVVHIATDFFIETHLCIDPSFVLEATPEKQALWHSYEEFLFRSLHWDTLPRYAHQVLDKDTKRLESRVDWTMFHVVAIDYAVLNPSTAKGGKGAKKRRQKTQATSSPDKPGLSSAELANAALFG